MFPEKNTRIKICQRKKKQKIEKENNTLNYVAFYDNEYQIFQE